MPRRSFCSSLSLLRLQTFVRALLWVQLSSTAAMKLHTITSKTPKGSTQYPDLLLVLVHGLDSSSKTWLNTMEALEKDTSCLAVDQRGCGYSPFGSLDDFSQETLVKDLHESILEHCSSTGTRKIVLLGHSLGGRIALGYAATHPELLAACIIEDMDIAPRQPDKNGFVQLTDYDGLFDRSATTKEALLDKLHGVGYPQSFLDKAMDQGRIEAAHPDNPFASQGWFSHVNPDFRRYCYPAVLSTTRAGLDCDTIAQGPANFPCHILVAGDEGTVCNKDSVQEMHQRLTPARATLHRYPTAGHSIHSTAAEEFLVTIRQILKDVR